MNKLNYKYIKNNPKVSEILDVGYLGKLPEKVIQFGEGNFLRGFVDWMFNKMNRDGLFNGKVVAIQPIKHGMIDKLNEQDGLYTLLLRGIKDGKIVQKKEIITSVSRGINIYSDYAKYLKIAENPDMRVVISNTTEAGISYCATDKPDDIPPSSYPAKLAVLLYERYKKFDGDNNRGFIIIPCELIEKNGDNLKRIVLQYSNEWNLETEFINWINSANFFLNTLVDRIVTGYPKDEIEKISSELGYEDSLMDTAEIFHLWVIEGDKKLSKELPFTQAGFNVIWTEDMTPYRSRKVRILNGAHTMMVLAAYLSGKDTVKECMDENLIRNFMMKGVFEEIIPTLDLPKNELIKFADDVIERFSNPFIKHYLLSISLNSVSKFKTRVLPSIEEYLKRKGRLPKYLVFSLAALIVFYKGTEIEGEYLLGSRDGQDYKIQDEKVVLEMFQKLWSEFNNTKESALILVTKVLSQKEMWGNDLNNIPGFAILVTDNLYNILSLGMVPSISKLEG